MKKYIVFILILGYFNITKVNAAPINDEFIENETC